MKKLCLLTAALAIAACGPKPKPYVDAGPDDAGVDAGEVDAGRLKGNDPPSGYSVAIELPAGQMASVRVGVSASLALDQFQQPMIAAISTDPNNDGVRVDDRLVFTRWNGADGGSYQTPVSIATIGQIDVSEPNRQVSLSRDISIGAIGVAFVDDQLHVRLAISNDEGANWSLETPTLNLASGHAVSNPSLVLDNGEVHLAYFEAEVQCGAPECGEIIYRHRVGKAAFSDATSPIGAGSDVTLAKPFALAVDSDHKAAVAYFSGVNAPGATVNLLFWRPDGTTTQKIADSGAAVLVKPISVSLAFEGNKPRVAYHLPSSVTANAQLWYAPATDSAGAAFTPVDIPRNSAGTTLEGTQSYQALAFDSTGRVAIAAFHNQSPIPNQCTGGPKVARAAAGSTTFAVCRADTTGVFGFAGEWINVAFHKPQKITLAFAYNSVSNPGLGNKGGVIIYREP
jgi:hypothetical protein